MGLGRAYGTGGFSVDAPGAVALADAGFDLYEAVVGNAAAATCEVDRHADLLHGWAGVTFTDNTSGEQGAPLVDLGNVSGRYEVTYLQDVDPTALTSRQGGLYASDSAVGGTLLQTHRLVAVVALTGALAGTNSSIVLDATSDVVDSGAYVRTVFDLPTPSSGNWILSFFPRTLGGSHTGPTTIRAFNVRKLGSYTSAFSGAVSESIASKTSVIIDGLTEFYDGDALLTTGSGKFTAPVDGQLTGVLSVIVDNTTTVAGDPINIRTMLNAGQDAISAPQDLDDAGASGSITFILPFDVALTEGDTVNGEIVNIITTSTFDYYATFSGTFKPS